MRLKFRTIVLALVMIGIIPCTAFCAEVSISVSPIRVEHLTKQGERGTDMFSVTNDGTAPTRLKVSIEDWNLTKDGTPVFMRAEKSAYSCAEWIRVNPVDFRINPGQTREVRYTINVPAGIESGGYRAAIVFETVPDAEPGEKARRVLLRGRIAAILYEVVGKTPVDGYATGLKAEVKQEEIDFTLSLKNTGKVHYRTKGSITIKDSNGNKALDVEIPDTPVLQDSEREVRVRCDKSLPKGTYSALASVDIGRKELVGAETTFVIE